MLMTAVSIMVICTGYSPYLFQSSAEQKFQNSDNDSRHNVALKMETLDVAKNYRLT